MPTASDEDPQPKRIANNEELADFADWGADFLDFLHSIPTAEEE